MFLVIGNSVIGTMINDKSSGMKEMLTINGLTNNNYMLNIFLQNAFFSSLISLAVVLIFTQINKGV
jgi:hypothetical protein